MITLKSDSATRDGEDIQELYPFQKDYITTGSIELKFDSLLKLIFSGNRLDHYSIIYREELDGKSLHAICRSIQDPISTNINSISYVSCWWNIYNDKEGWFDIIPRFSGVETRSRNDKKYIVDLDTYSASELRALPFFINESITFKTGEKREKKFKVRDVLSAVFSSIAEV